MKIDTVNESTVQDGMFCYGYQVVGGVKTDLLFDLGKVKSSDRQILTTGILDESTPNYLLSITGRYIIGNYLIKTNGVGARTLTIKNDSFTGDILAITEASFAGKEDYTINKQDVNYEFKNGHNLIIETSGVGAEFEVQFEIIESLLTI